VLGGDEAGVIDGVAVGLEVELVDGAGWTEDTACSGSTEDGATGGGAGALDGATGGGAGALDGATGGGAGALDGATGGGAGALDGATGGAEALAVVVVDAAGLGPGAQ
jgi:hypothetical protein